MKKYLLFFIFLLVSINLYSQINKNGIPFIKNYKTNEYDAAAQNWAICQNTYGIIYIGNNDNGVLEYDGDTWNKIPVSNNSVVRSLTVADDGTIYVGAVNEFGYLSPDKSGKMLYHSLSSQLDTANFLDVWKTYSTKDGVYFCSMKKIFRYANDEIETIDLPEGSFFAFNIDDIIYFGNYKKGLYSVEDDSYMLCKGGNFYIDKDIFLILPYKDNKLLISCNNELFIYDISTGNSVKPISDEYKKTEARLKKGRLYHGEKIGDNYLFNTLGKGTFLVNSEFKIIEQFDVHAGLQDGVCIYSFFPKEISNYQNVLWLGLNNGISKVEVSLPFRYFNEKFFSKHHNIYDIVRYNDTLFITTDYGLYYQGVKNINGDSKFYEIECRERINSLLINNDNLYAYNEKNLYRITNRRMVLTKEIGAYHLQNSKIDSKKIIGENSKGLFFFKFNNNTVKIVKELKKFTSYINDIIEDNMGNLWISNMYDDELYFYNTKQDSMISINTDIFEDKRFYMLEFENQIFFSNYDNVFIYDNENKEFIEPKELNYILKEKFKDARSLTVDSKGGIWIIPSYLSKENIRHLIKNQNGEYINDSLIFKRVPANYRRIYADLNEIVWLETSEGLLTYNTNYSSTYNSNFYTLIRKVSVSNDSIIFNGGYINQINSLVKKIEHPQNFIPSISYNYNNIKFSYSAAFYIQEDSTKYSYKLEKFDEKWSEWSIDSKREYTNLNSGNYVFKVKAKNIYGLESIISEYKFEILKPWYLTLAAIVFYLIAFVFLIIGIVKLNTKRLIVEKKKLEKKVSERTIEVQQANEEITAQRDEIEAQRDMVMDQKEKIEEVNEELTDSIHYAQYIQNALLPQVDLREQLLPEHFIFFKPKNIVSGDFYWLTKVEGRIIVTAADCTGHGVPGAFMSMLGISFLNDVVNKEYITHPGVILRRLRKEVVHALQQKGKYGEQRDGMDIALCSINFENLELQFSGANNPLYLIRDKEKEPVKEAIIFENSEVNLYEIKGDKMPIAIHDRMDKFKMHEIKLFKGDCLYMFSDGFADQFGGENGKKFKYKPFKDLLLANARKPMKQQFDILDNTLNKWQRDFEQVDDILVIGIKI